MISGFFIGWAIVREHPRLPQLSDNKQLNQLTPTGMCR